VRGRYPRRRAGLDALAEIAEPDHGARVTSLAVALAEALGWEARDQARLHQAARLHDGGSGARLAAPRYPERRLPGISQPQPSAL
jgi:hypothetical protein